MMKLYTIKDTAYIEFIWHGLQIRTSRGELGGNLKKRQK